MLVSLRPRFSRQPSPRWFSSPQAHRIGRRILSSKRRRQSWPRKSAAWRNIIATIWRSTGSARRLPNWSQPCPIHAQVAPQLGAGGATSFTFDHSEVFGWHMEIQGSHERLLDSVLPHEVTHTIFASHFRRPLPRWADEGACTTVEDISERSKQDRMLIQFLHTGRGIAFSQMFAMTDYPQDILPLYAQGYSLARFLMDQKGKREFLAYVGDGMASENWTAATNKFYGYKNLAVLQDAWLNWVKQGSPAHSRRQSSKRQCRPRIEVRAGT